MGAGQGFAAGRSAGASTLPEKRQAAGRHAPLESLCRKSRTRASLAMIGAGKDTGGHYHFTDVWVKKGGRWQVVASHGLRFNEAH